MSRAVRYIFFGFVAIVLQTTLVPGIGLAGQRPDLIVVFAVLVGAYQGASAGCLAGFIAGFLVDIYHPPTLGAGTIAGTLAGYVGGRAQEILDLDLPLNQATAFAFARVVHDFAYGIVASIKGEGGFWGLFLGRVFGGAVYTALVGTAIIALIALVRGGKHVIRRKYT
jgi:rod shape-determining protein MreD